MEHFAVAVAATTSFNIGVWTHKYMQYNQNNIYSYHVEVFVSFALIEFKNCACKFKVADSFNLSVRITFDHKVMTIIRYTVFDISLLCLKHNIY